MMTPFGGFGPKEPTTFKGAKLGINGVIDFFRYAAMHKWADEVQGALRNAANFNRGSRKREVVLNQSASTWTQELSFAPKAMDHFIDVVAV